MFAHAYAEDQLVEEPAIGLFEERGWITVSAMEETFGATGTLPRETKGEVVLVTRLRTAFAFCCAKSKSSARRATCCCRACCRGTWN